MGGLGSGGWYRWSTKSTTANFWNFHIKTLKKYGLFNSPMRKHGSWSWSQNGEERSNISYELNTLDEHSPYIRVHYTNKNTEEKHDYKIRLSTTSPNYGGKRWWFHCPAARCGKRVGVLFMGNIFACRHCYNIAYPSQNESPAQRMLSRAQKIQQQLGGSGCMDELVIRPKGMHKKTFERKFELMNRLEEVADGLMFQCLGRWLL